MFYQSHPLPLCSLLSSILLKVFRDGHQLSPDEHNSFGRQIMEALLVSLPSPDQKAFVEATLRLLHLKEIPNAPQSQTIPLKFDVINEPSQNLLRHPSKNQFQA